MLRNHLFPVPGFEKTAVFPFELWRRVRLFHWFSLKIHRWSALHVEKQSGAHDDLVSLPDRHHHLSSHIAFSHVVQQLSDIHKHDVPLGVLPIIDMSCGES